MVTPTAGFSEKVRARIIELTGKDPGLFQIMDIFPGEKYDEISEADRIEEIAQSLMRIKPGDFEAAKES